MIFTARQLQDLQAKGQGHGQIVLPYGARLTPLAVDWARGKKIQIGYGPKELSESHHPSNSASADPKPSPLGAGTLLWWCDGPCGAAKAALSAQARETPLAALEVPGDNAHLVAAIRRVASAVKSGEAAGGILLVKTAAEAVVYANRCASLRAVVGTCLEAVDQSIAALAANVLIVEYPYKNLPQVRNLLSRFARGSKTPSEQAQQRLRELATCA